MSEEVVASKGKAKNEVWEWIKAIAIAVGLAFLIRTFLFAPFIVEGESMETTLHNAEKLLVNKAIYFLREPERGEIVVFHAEPTRDYIKRVIAIPGDTIEIRNDTLYINGEVVPEPYLEENRKRLQDDFALTEDIEPLTVGEGQIYVMGDNRRNSKDSRTIGPVDIDSVVGRAEFVFWPLSNIRMTR